MNPLSHGSFAETLIETPARLSRLRYLKQCIPDPIDIADADIEFGQTYSRDIFSETALSEEILL